VYVSVCLNVSAHPLRFPVDLVHHGIKLIIIINRGEQLIDNLPRISLDLEPQVFKLPFLISVRRRRISLRRSSLVKLLFKPPFPVAVSLRVSLIRALVNTTVNERLRGNGRCMTNQLRLLRQVLVNVPLLEHSTLLACFHTTPYHASESIALIAHVGRDCGTKRAFSIEIE
jgi:hypothetical protein